MRRLFLIALLMALLAPGTWLRTKPAPPDYTSGLAVTPIAFGQALPGDVEIVGAWELESRNGHFGSYSALLALPGGDLFAASDRGRYVRFPIPGSDGDTHFGWFSGDADTLKNLIDIEALTRDAESGRIWAAYEGTNTIERRGSVSSAPTRAAPEAIAGFGNNQGPEAFERLSDGRFLVLSEGPRTFMGNIHSAYLFAGDPVEGSASIRTAFRSPEGYRPTDLAQLPDGRLMILVRRVAWGFPPRFPVKLVLADPADIVEGEEWSGDVIASIAEPLPSDNFEGLAAIPQSDGSVELWLISDDNNSAFQRTLLMKLRWLPSKPPDGAKEKARG